MHEAARHLVQDQAAERYLYRLAPGAADLEQPDPVQDASFRAPHQDRHGGGADLWLVAPFPCSRASLARKLLRDLVGVNGLTRFVGRFLRGAGYLQWTVASEAAWLPRERVSLLDRVKLFLCKLTPP